MKPFFKKMYHRKMVTMTLGFFSLVLSSFHLRNRLWKFWWYWYECSIQLNHITKGNFYYDAFDSSKIFVFLSLPTILFQMAYNFCFYSLGIEKYSYHKFVARAQPFNRNRNCTTDKKQIKKKIPECKSNMVT